MSPRHDNFQYSYYNCISDSMFYNTSKDLCHHAIKICGIDNSTMLLLVITFGSIGFLGNTAFIFVVARVKSMRTLPNYYIINLAVADVLCLISFLLQPVLYQFAFASSETFVFLRVFIIDTGTFTSILTVAMISTDRYIALCRPMRANGIKRRIRVLTMIALTWLVGILLGLCEYLTVTLLSGQIAATVVILVFACVTVFFLVFVVLLYSLIAKEFAVKCLRLPSRGILPSSARLREERQVLGICLIIVFVFFVCIAPSVYILLLSAITLFYPNVSLHSEFNYCMISISPVMMIINFALNPFVYNLPSGNHRIAFRQAFSGQMAQRYTVCRMSAHRSRSSGKNMEISGSTAVADSPLEIQMTTFSLLSPL
ncbi:neuropeptides capa receptor-like [Saccoglossus kowalevskii]|uniref:Neuropeptides capa receptor-like n=1 Tax=Saccoglossus kowalevskii TaxID=10224 RepID=A0ABM0MR37_SACKO|nr:PREDICTED: neuropeptides capa receptor-like [Saccoglossus kowalevskii]